jgi:hypothetical protein
VLHGTGAVGVRLTGRDGARDVLGFRTDLHAKTVSCGNIESRSRVFAQRTDDDERVIRRFRYPQE